MEFQFYKSDDPSCQAFSIGAMTAEIDEETAKDLLLTAALKRVARSLTDQARQVKRGVDDPEVIGVKILGVSFSYVHNPKRKPV